MERESKMKVCVVGLGYIGLPTAVMLASHGIEVIGTDYSEAVVDSLKKGNLTFEEEGLEEAFSAAVDSGISFASDYPVADVYIIAVPTPYESASKKIDPSYVVSAVESVLDSCEMGAIIAIESTVSPGTIDKHIRPVVEAKGLRIGSDVHLAHAPERIIPGRMIYELVHNSRTIGADSPEIAERVKDIYSSFCEGEIIVTDIRTAEMSKVVENTFRDINIAYANELAKICRSGNMDVYEIIRIANHHPRVNILSPGPGVGGHCISVDPWFLVGDYPSLSLLIHQARQINDSMPDYVLQRVSEIMRERGIKDASRVGFYGMTYKENVDDTRESPTLQLLDSLERHLCSGVVKVYDPFVKRNLVEGQMRSLSDFLNSVDLVVIMVAHDEITSNAELLKGKVVFDTRNCMDLEGVERL